ncbi:MAG: DUF4160 domain-containing protein, partial [Calditrichaeota bacterium]|nr:DUF4160 domain-containing protein [Calditrichota bacterium]
IEHISLIDGKMPKRLLRKVLEWTTLHQSELLSNWRLIREDKNPNQVDP